MRAVPVSSYLRPTGRITPARHQEKNMKINKNDIPARIDAPGAVARQVSDFGTADGYSEMAGEYFSMGAGVDIRPLLEGLPGNSCDAPHWGYVMQGRVVVTFDDRPAETVSTGDLFYWPPGHSVRVEEDAELILFSPAHEHTVVMDHMKRKMALA
jgi:AraC-like ligand binding domain